MGRLSMYAHYFVRCLSAPYRVWTVRSAIPITPLFTLHYKQPAWFRLTKDSCYAPRRAVQNMLIYKEGRSNDKRFSVSQTLALWFIFPSFLKMSALHQPKDPFLLLPALKLSIPLCSIRLIFCFYMRPIQFFLISACS